MHVFRLLESFFKSNTKGMTEILQGKIMMEF